MTPIAPTLPEARWQLSVPASRSELLRVMAEFEVSPMLGQVLSARQLTRAHLMPELTLTPNSGLLEAAARLVAAIKAGKRIRIHGDYDADGVSATATLVWGLREIGANVHGFIPHRLNEGYGVHPSKLSEHAQAADVLVTVDCGVTNLEEVRGLLALGLEVIVTDHHSPGPDFPDCLVVHPKLTENYDPELHNLTGAGVAYHLLWAIYNQLGLGSPTHLTPLATLGTVADVAPLIGENRALVVTGLAEFEQTQLPGVRALMNGKTTVTARDVGFVLAPRINAAGRMGEADVALDLLTTTSKQEAEKIAAYLEIKNGERRALQDSMFKEALELVDPSDPAIVITKSDWHPGVMGIVASKLLETHYKPVYIVAQGKGSVRSTPGISAVQGLYYSESLLKRFGGHPGAAGFSLDMDNFAAFRSSIHDYARQFPRPLPRVQLDASLPPAAASLDFVGEIERFEPYGEGHRPPLWHLRSELSHAKLIGKDKSTLSFTVGGVRAIKYRESRVLSGTHDLALHLQRNTWNNRDSAEFMGEALRVPQPLSLMGELASEFESISTLPRLDPSHSMQHLKADAAAYASSDIAAYLQTKVPQVVLLGADADPTNEVVLYTLPPEDTLKRWLAQGQVSFAWGKNTLSELEGHSHGQRAVLSGLDYAQESVRQQAADTYRRMQWAHLYQTLDDQGFARAVWAMLGLEPETTQAEPTQATSTQERKIWAAN